MSSVAPQVDNGAFIPTGAIYNKVLELERKVVKLETTIAIVGLLVTPLLSTVVATIVTSVMGG